MKILVCITHVPDTTSRIAFSDNNSKFDTNGVQFIIGPYDDYALARAIEIKEAQQAAVTVVCAGGPETEPTIRKALAIGADDAIRINFLPTDSFQVATQLASVIKEGGYDLVLMGRESIDHNGGVVHAMTAELLGWPSVSPVMKLDLNGNTATMVREIEGGKETVQCDLPLIAGCQEPIAEWKIPNMRGIMGARTKPLKVVEPTSNESRSQVTRFELPPTKGAVKMIPAEQVSELVTRLKNEAKVL
ncbi:MAG: electron transfer flavoprotein subunit beta/FixA family protein [Bacteroidetes bacterium]|nr:electron transfer flavoprotein subunit beta/FixA family protein [Bacteroidota bacterium]